MNFIAKHKGFFFVLFFVSLWVTSLFFVSPQEIVSFIGVEGEDICFFF